MLVEGTVGSTAKAGGDMHEGETMIEPKHYGLHRHFTGGSLAVMFGGDVWRWHEARHRLRRDCAGASAHGDQGSGEHHRDARDDFHRDGHPPEDRLRHREAPLLCDAGRARETGEGALRAGAYPTTEHSLPCCVARGHPVCGDRGLQAGSLPAAQPRCLCSAPPYFSGRMERSL